jgi:hypothetical protein
MGMLVRPSFIIPQFGVPLWIGWQYEDCYEVFVRLFVALNYDAGSTCTK